MGGTRKKQKKSHNLDDNSCKLCLSSTEDEIMYGKKLDTQFGPIHYHCILFACGLEQKGEEEEGVYGFMLEDIRKELLRANKLKCSFCKKGTVASACAVKECRVKYHFSCGLNNNVLFHYFDSFESYCVKHRPDRDVLDTHPSKINNELTCHICLEKFNEQENSDENLKYKVLLTKCCSKFLHIVCVKKQAFNAGIHFLKCPLCNDRDKFIDCAQQHGIYIPDEDAKWERDWEHTQAWRDQESRYEFCDAINCKCPFERGRKFVGEECSGWEINLCSTCGSYGIHTNCSNEAITEEFECPDCYRLNIRRLNEVTSNFCLNDDQPLHQKVIPIEEIQINDE